MTFYRHGRTLISHYCGIHPDRLIARDRNRILSIIKIQRAGIVGIVRMSLTDSRRFVNEEVGGSVGQAIFRSIAVYVHHRDYAVLVRTVFALRF